MAETPARRKRWWWLSTILLALCVVLLLVLRGWARDAEINTWMAEAASRSLLVRRYDEPVFAAFRHMPGLDRIFRRPGVMVIGHVDADLTPLAKMRPCPARITFGHTGPVSSGELKKLEAQFAAAIEAQQSSRD